MLNGYEQMVWQWNAAHWFKYFYSQIIAYRFWVMFNKLKSFHKKTYSSNASIGIISSTLIKQRFREVRQERQCSVMVMSTVVLADKCGSESSLCPLQLCEPVFPSVKWAWYHLLLWSGWHLSKTRNSNLFQWWHVSNIPQTLSIIAQWLTNGRRCNGDLPMHFCPGSPPTTHGANKQL